MESVCRLDAEEFHNSDQVVAGKTVEPLSVEVAGADLLSFGAVHGSSPNSTKRVLES